MLVARKWVVDKMSLVRVTATNEGSNASSPSEKRPSVPPRFQSEWLGWLLMLLCVLVLWLRQLDHRAHLDMTGNQRQQSDAFFLRKWTQHMLWHPIKPSDRTGFAEMGLRTRIYSRLLETGDVPSFDTVERSLWPFAPGISRQRQTLRTEKTVTDKREHGASKDGSRGIVMSLGRSEVRFAMHFLQMLRNVHGSTMPVEIFYYGDDDLPPSLCTLLETSYSGVRTIDLEATGLFDPQLSRLARQGWAIKPFAMLATNLSEVMLVDADVVLLSPPERFFEVPGYRDTGTLFFHDRDHFRQGASDIIQRFMHDQLGQRGPSVRLSKSAFWTKRGIYEQESGVVLANKRSSNVLSALLFAAWQNTGYIREQTTYRVFWGDKESYWLAFELAGFPYYFVDHYSGGISVGGQHSGAHDLCSDHPLHFLGNSGTGEEAPSPGSMQRKEQIRRLGRPAWFNGSLLVSKSTGSNTFLANTTWAVDGEWDFAEQTERWCLQAKTVGTMDDFGLSDTFARLVAAAGEADERFLAMGV